MTLKYTMICLILLGMTVANGRAGEPIITDFDRDIKVLKKSVEGLDESEKPLKAISRISERYAKAETAKLKQSLMDDLNELKVDLILDDEFPDAWRATLARALKINSKYLAGDVLPVEDVKAKIDSERTRLLEKNYPISKRMALEKTAIARFPTVSIGDSISLVINGRSVSGRLNSLSSTSAMIGSTTYMLSDLPPSFHVKRMVDERRAFVKRNYMDMREAYLKTLNKKLPARVYRKNGYIYYNGDWVHVKDVTAIIEERIAELTELAVEKKEKRAALIAKLKLYGIIGAAVFGVLVILGIIVALKTRKS